MTGFYRDGCCNTGDMDTGQHTVCAEMTREFLQFSVVRGNDLVTPRPEWNFPGLKPGDFWCICVLRWREAYLAGCAPKVRLEATHEDALKFVKLEELKEHAIKINSNLGGSGLRIEGVPMPETPDPEWN
ncbi:MAG: hypothetical protein RJA81_1388 [Planctomycetota bacterium]|jgi:uncharacterized protein (DUF2237 family)